MKGSVCFSSSRFEIIESEEVFRLVDDEWQPRRVSSLRHWQRSDDLLSGVLDGDDYFLSRRPDLSFSNQSWRFHHAQRSLIPLKSQPIHSNETDLFAKDLREIKSQKVFDRRRWVSRHDRSNSPENRQCIFYFLLGLSSSTPTGSEIIYHLRWAVAKREREKKEEREACQRRNEEGHWFNPSSVFSENFIHASLLRVASAR